MLVETNVVFIDRDGVINRKMPEGVYVKSWSEFVFLPRVFDALMILKNNGYRTIIFTNQRCIARRIVSEETIAEIHTKMLEEMNRHDVNVEGIYVCPHDIDFGCECRKPKPGMLLRAIKDLMNSGLVVNIRGSYLIGDSEIDILAGRALGLRGIKIGTYSDIAEKTLPDLYDCAKLIATNETKK